MTPQRKQAEALIYEVMDKLDPKEYNSSYYKNLFADIFETFLLVPLLH